MSKFIALFITLLPVIIMLGAFLVAGVEAAEAAGTSQFNSMFDDAANPRPGYGK